MRRRIVIVAVIAVALILGVRDEKQIYGQADELGPQVKSPTQTNPQEAEDPVVSLVKTVSSLDGRVLQLGLRWRYMDACRSGGAVASQSGRGLLAPLVAVEGVYVFLSPELKDCGLMGDTVKTSVELELRRNGIQIEEPPVDPNEYKAWMLSHPEAMFQMSPLFVEVESISLSDTPIMAANIKVSQNQLANLLSSDTPKTISVSTWSKTTYMIGGREVVAQGCRGVIDDLVKVYCNDWLAAHPNQHTQSPTTPDNQEAGK